MGASNVTRDATARGAGEGPNGLRCMPAHTPPEQYDLGMQIVCPKEYQAAIQAEIDAERARQDAADARKKRNTIRGKHERDQAQAREEKAADRAAERASTPKATSSGVISTSTSGTSGAGAGSPVLEFVGAATDSQLGKVAAGAALVAGAIFVAKSIFGGK